MLIRKEQAESLEEVRMPDFGNYMVGHLADFTPLHTKSLGEPGIRELISQGMARANSHEFTWRGPVRFYIETCVLLGIDFDTDPQYPELGRILREETLPDQVQRADAAHAWLTDFLEAAGGPDREYAKAALRRARALPFPSKRATGFREHALRQMRETHPEKAAYLGDQPLLDLLGRVLEEARRYEVATEDGVGLFAALMFAVGHGVTGDPKYPWVAGTLTNPAVAPERRVERLYSKTMTYLDSVLEHLGEQ